jgi:glycosyltransferase involved in cell wall biosynthesis
VTLLKTAFWASAGLLVYTHAGYPAALAVLDRLRSVGVGDGDGVGVGGRDVARRREPSDDAALPGVSVIVAAYAEQEVIAARVANLLALDYPREKLEVIVACDGSPDDTARRAREAGADVVLELPREGKVRTQDAAVARARHQITAFSDANVSWAPDALRRLVEPFADPRVGYVCGDVRFVNDSGTNQEGLYWRYEMAVRRLESRLCSVTGGNGAIYATRRHSYIVVDPIMGHDLSFPFNMVKRGWRAVYAPGAHATEKMVPTIEGEFRRKRRMMSHGWPIMLRGGMLSPRDYDPGYAVMIVSHRALRYASPFLHLAALAAAVALIRAGWVYVCAAILQAALLAAALAAGAVPARPLLVARYYVLTTASLAAGLWDWLAHGTQVGWEAAEGTR